MKLTLICLGFFVLVVSVTHAAILGIDLGEEWIKTSIVKPGVPIDIVLNPQTKRKDPNCVGFNIDGDRVLSDDALMAAGRQPKTVFSHLSRFLGKTSVDEVRQFVKDMYLPYELVQVEGRDTLGFRANGDVFSIEELVAMVLTHVREMGEANAGSPIKDVVITVPSFFTQRERRALEDAAELAGLNVLALVTDHTAVALQYGIQHSAFSNKTTHTAMFFDMGSGSLKVSISEFSMVNQTNQVQVLASSYDTGVGGAQFDRLVTEELANRWNRKHGGDIRKNDRAMTRLFRAATKAKEVLSANSEAYVSIEGLLEERDFSTVLTREDFEAMSQDLIERMKQTVRRCLTAAGMTEAGIDAVLVVGGASRVPMVKAGLQAELNREQLNMSLNGDEAIALGAGFFGARLSTSFRVKPFNVFDVYSWPIDLIVRGNDTEEDMQGTQTVLFAANSKVPSKKQKVTLSREQNVDLVLRYSDDAVLPEGTPRDIMQFQIRGIPESIARTNHTSEPKLKVFFRLSHSGMVEMAGSEMYMEEERSVVVNATAEEPVYTTKTYAHRVPVQVTTQVTSNVALSREAFMDARKHLRDISEREQLRRKTSDARNALESFIYETRERLERDDILAVSTEEQRSELSTAISKAGDWLDSDGFDAELDVLVAKRKALLTVASPMFTRAYEQTARPEAVENAVKLMKELKDAIARWNITKPHITEDERNEALAAIARFEDWLQAQQAKQESLAPSDTPAFVSDDVTDRSGRAEIVVKRLARKPLPKPPKKAKTEKAEKTEKTDKTEKTAESESETTTNEAKPDNVESENVDPEATGSTTTEDAGTGDSNSTGAEDKHDEL